MRQLPFDGQRTAASIPHVGSRAGASGTNQLRLSSFSLALVLLLGAVSAAPAQFPQLDCQLNADKSQLSLVASNPTGQRYQCISQCKYSVKGSPALLRPNCNTFNLPANTSAKTVCAVKGNGPGHFTRVEPSGFTCAPR
jgi:hypothetical protein